MYVLRLSQYGSMILIICDPAATLFSFIIVSAYKHSFLQDPPLAVLRSLDQIWRLIIGLGCIPAAVAIYFRLTIPETPRFTMDIERNIKQATSDVDALLSREETYTVDPDALTQRVRARQATNHDFLSYFSKWENLKQPQSYVLPLESQKGRLG